MIDAELKKYLEDFRKDLDVIRKNSNSYLNAFLHGVLRGLGSIIGVAIFIFFLGWILNAVGVIPGLRDWAQSIEQSLEEIRRIR